MTEYGNVFFAFMIVDGFTGWNFIRATATEKFNQLPRSTMLIIVVSDPWKAPFNSSTRILSHVVLAGVL